MVWQQDRLDGAEKMVMKTDELATRVREVEMSEKQEMALVAEYRAAREQEAADRAHRATQQQLDEVHKAREKREAQTQQALAVAEEGRKKTVERLRAATGGLAQKLAELDAARQKAQEYQGNEKPILKGPKKTIFIDIPK